MTAADQLADVIDVEGALWDQDDVGAAREPGLERDPARVAAHHLDHHHAVVGLRGRVQPVDRLGGDLERRVEAEGHIGGGEVVVDRLRDAEHRNVVLTVEPRRGPQRVLAADRD